MSGARHPMAGVIASTGFASGDRVVVGHWHRSPIGPFSDVMWGRADGTRVLLSQDRRSEELITAVYEFDHCEVVPVQVRHEPRRLDLDAGPLRVTFVAGRLWPIPLRRPAWFTRLVEAPIARATMGVRTYGVSPTGVREWYRADGYRRLLAVDGTNGGVGMGPFGPLDPPLGVGFTDPPGHPSLVLVRPLLQDPSGRLDQIVSRRR
ncbi:MAG: hypothetical protein JJE52_15805 [Acidimicrobiia bacterium]|nr:hypothetical protein [Acidimicrobiia bacterium]